MNKNKDERREKILDETEAMVLHQGFRRFNLDQLARRLRMSKNTIYYYFPSKEELFFAALNRRASRLMQRLKEIVAMDASARDKLFVASQCIVSESAEMDNSLLRDLEELFPDFFGLSQTFFRQVVKYIGIILEDGAKRREFRKDINPAVLTRTIRGIGAYLIEQDFLTKNKLTVEKVYSEAMGVLMDGILEREA